MSKINENYLKWADDPTPENMAVTLSTLDPIISSEVNRYPGPKHVMRSKARELAVNAVKTYDPASGTQLGSWVVTQLQPLNRYGRQTAGGSVRMPEVAARQAAELETIRRNLLDDLGDEPTDEQLADETGLSVTRVRNLRNMSKAVITEGQLEEAAPLGDDEAAAAPAVLDTGADPGLHTALEIVSGELNDRDRSILEMRTGYNGKPVLDNNTIAKRLGVSPALISQRAAVIAGRLMEVRNRV